MTVRAGIVVTGTEVLSGIIADRNGPWLAERLRERGVETAQIVIVGDRPADVRAALGFLAGEGADLIVTSGGLGPTADDLTAEVVGAFAGRAMVLDEALEERILAILRRNRAGWRDYSEEAMRAGNRKQAVVPEGAAILEPVGTAPGAARAARGGRRAAGRGAPRPAGRAASDVGDGDADRAAAGPAGACGDLRAAHAAALRRPGVGDRARRCVAIEDEGVPLDRLEITTCLRRGRDRDRDRVRARRDGGLRRVRRRDPRAPRRHAVLGGRRDDRRRRSRAALDGRTIAVAESCTGGLMAGRLTDRAGSSAYVLGGVVVYSNEAKTAFAGVPETLIERHGAVSPEVAAALADGAIARFGAGLGIGITGHRGARAAAARRSRSAPCA